MGPPGGTGGVWTFPVSPNCSVSGATFELLAKAVFEWRLANAQNPGQVEADIDAYYCRHWPEACSPEAVDSQYPAGVSADDKMSDRVLSWVTGMVDVRRVPQGGWPLVSLKAAEARAAICASCHRNVDFPSGCGGCDDSVRQASARIRSHRASALPHSLRACTLFGWHNESAGHLTADALSVPPDDERRKLAPPACWLAPTP